MPRFLPGSGVDDSAFCHLMRDGSGGGYISFATVVVTGILRDFQN
jgi:hypothetical protein